MGKGLLAVGLLGAGLGAGVFWFDRIVGDLYGRFRPTLERQIGTAMGRPLALGPYRGLNADGVWIGPSRFLAGPQDSSTATVEAVRLRLDPMASLLLRGPVLDLGLKGARADLRRNARGQFWVLGSAPPGREPPRIDLRLGLLQPGAVRVWGAGATARPLDLTLSGQVAVRLHRREIDLGLRLAPPAGGGSLLVDGGGQWQTQQWLGRLTARRFPLAPLRSLFPSGDRAGGSLAGVADGRLGLTINKGLARCDGGLELRDLRWQLQTGSVPLTAERLPLSCRDRALILPASPWRYGTWGGRLTARAEADRRLDLQLVVQPPPRHPLGRQPLQADLKGRWGDGLLRLTRLDGRLGRSTLRASGSVGRSLALDARWRLDPDDFPAAAKLPEWLRQPLAGRLRADGRLAAPRLRLETGQASQRLLGPWQAALVWRDRLLRLERFEADRLKATAQLPLSFQAGKGLVAGPLLARVDVQDYPLARLNPLLGTTLQGQLDGAGTIAGPLAELRPDLQLRLEQPGAGPLLLRETWSGSLKDRSLDLTAVAPTPQGRITALLDRRWQPVRAAIDRDGGQLSLDGRPAGYRWVARAFPLRGLSVATGPNRRLRPLEGDLSGSGRLGLQPLSFDGRVELLSPQFLGVGGRRIQADVAYDDRQYRVNGQIEPLGEGSIAATVSGRWNGPFRARFEARQLSTLLFRQLNDAWPIWRGAPAPQRGRASDLGSLVIDTMAGTVTDQLLALAQAEQRVAARVQAASRASRAERLERLQARIDADLLLSGPDFARTRADLKATGHLWYNQGDRAQALAGKPFEVRLEGPLTGGSGSFSLADLPLSLLALLTPLPENLRGALAARGRYRLGGARPELSLDLALVEGRLGEEALALERGRVELKAEGIGLDLALRAEGASRSVDLSGTIPLVASQQGLELRLATRGDGLRFLTRLGGQAFTWQEGGADLQLLVRGSLDDPIANGFLRLRELSFRFIGQEVREVEATILFDFEQLVVQEFRARVGPKGVVVGDGRLGLFRPLAEDKTLVMKLEQVPFSVPRVVAVGDGQLHLSGSLLAPVLGGDVAIGRGTINVQPGQLAASEPVSDQPVQPRTMPELLESKWTFDQPLVLLGPDVESTTAEALRGSVPRFPYLAFEDLTLRLGPDLRVVIPNIANFTTAGRLRINGRLDPSLRASGVVRLLGGRLSLFTTSFSLDPDAPNVAIFTPSMGLVPYLDIALRTRISDSLSVLSPSGVGEVGPSVQNAPNQAGLSALNQLNLILVVVAVSGPADRIAENLTLRSSPPLPQERLVALIGGNSLAGLSGGGAGAALATVVGQTLLSPLLASLSDAFGQRVSLALYPTYVNQSIDTERERTSRRVPPQLVLGAEIGVDITNRFSMSVLAAPNRSDVPPQVTLTYKASDTFNLQTSVDTEGAWQSLLQVFLRF
ncbi:MULTISPECIES: translocation/assembly module TamB domain-containing protein [unclassified Cyanobium]|uniref:translocation/assembly module TamB domain-containing protein n=1 Tax=unclassified Cyanobium TaxID=2627006 RepID=UPI0028F40E6C|nr:MULTISPECIES: translocation/assembly module TamB domain-containing protein [unclassified Cyanobium]MCP9832852.1 translocation/assembly module TamB domain-containing protein [Cyanobium sp. La Preciosa 7G6]MCP9935602.1 translocation/assembly module TamB domain-containing protein [Cyanobium sp. Aljojuca 7A6]